MEKVQDYKNKVVHKLTSGVEALLKSNGVDIYKGIGRINKNHDVVVNDSQIIKADKIILAGGSKASKINIPGIESDKVLTSDDLLAIKEVPGTLAVIGGGRPAGLCGSGLIDCLAKLKRAGIIDRTGSFQEVATPRLRHTDEGAEFVLAWAAESIPGKDIVITEADIKNLIRSKGAVFAGIQSLLKTVALELEAIDRIIIAGGFGNYLNIPNAVEIGLLADLPAAKYVFAGNTSLKGAELALLSWTAWQEALELARKMTYLELSAGNLFMEEFVSALFLPHTQLELFPSVSNGIGMERREG